MRPTPSTGRRTFLKTTAAVAVAGPLLAGCTSTGTANSGDGSAGGDSNDVPATSGDSGSASANGDTPAFGGWLDDTANYDGTVADETSADTITVTVGAETSSGPYVFAPSAVEIGTGTTVTWEWTGEGGAHNVVARNGSFESELSAEKGYTFEHTFDSSGTYKYFCTPHKAMGMKGVVVVK